MPASKRPLIVATTIPLMIILLVAGYIVSAVAEDQPKAGSKKRQPDPVTKVNVAATSVLRALACKHIIKYSASDGLRDLFRDIPSAIFEDLFPGKFYESDLQALLGFSSIERTITEQYAPSNEYNEWDIGIVKFVSDMIPAPNEQVCGMSFAELYSQTGVSTVARHLMASIIYLHEGSILKDFNKAQYLTYSDKPSKYERICTDYMGAVQKKQIFGISSQEVGMGIPEIYRLEYDACHFWFRRWLDDDSSVRKLVVTVLVKKIIIPNDDKFYSAHKKKILQVLRAYGR